MSLQSGPQPARLRGAMSGPSVRLSVGPSVRVLHLPPVCSSVVVSVGDPIIFPTACLSASSGEHSVATPAAEVGRLGPTPRAFLFHEDSLTRHAAAPLAKPRPQGRRAERIEARKHPSPKAALTASGHVGRARVDLLEGLKGHVLPRDPC